MGLDPIPATVFKSRPDRGESREKPEGLLDEAGGGPEAGRVSEHPVASGQIRWPWRPTPCHAGG